MARDIDKNKGKKTFDETSDIPDFYDSSDDSSIDDTASVTASIDDEELHQQAVDEKSKRSERKKRKQRIKTVLSVVAVTAVLVLVVLFIVNINMFTAANIKSFFNSLFNESSLESTLDWNLSSDAEFDIFNGGIVSADYSGLRMITTDGIESSVGSFIYPAPVLKALNGRILAYDKDSSSLLLTDGNKVLLGKNNLSPLIYAGLSAGGVAVVYAESGYLCTVVAYNNSCETVFEFKTPDYFGSVAELSNDGKHLVFLGISSVESDIEVSALIFDISKAEIAATLSLGSSMPVALYELSENTFSVVCDDRVISFDSDGNVKGEFIYDREELLNCSAGNGFLVCAFNSKRTGERYDFITLDSDCVPIAEHAESREPTAFDAGGDRIAVIFRDEICVYNSSLVTEEEYNLGVYLEDVSCNEDGKIAALCDGIIYIPG